MNRGAARQPTFLADIDRVEFERLLGVGHDRFGVAVHAYCLMDNHFHLLLHCPNGDLANFMRDLSSVYTRHVNERIGRDGPPFRGRYRSVVVDTNDYLINAVRYIHRNPLDIVPAVQLDRYRWSSHRVYLGRRRQPSWMRTDAVLSEFNDAMSFDRFVNEVPHRTFDRINRDQLASIIELVADEHDIDGSGIQRAAARTVSVLLLDRLEGAERVEVAAQIGIATPGAQRTALSRARRRAANDPRLGLVADRICTLVA
jgi:putative transposase